MQFSILVSTKNRQKLFRRHLYSIANRPPGGEYEVIFCDDGSTEDVLGEIKAFSSRFRWTFIRVDNDLFEKETGIKHFFNCSALTYNIAARYAQGEFLYVMGNEIIAWENVFEQMWAEKPATQDFMVVSTTYDVPQEILNVLDAYGQNLNDKMVEYSQQWPLQSEFYRSDVTNYVSLLPKATWERVGGIDERYMGGISAEDSDFVRRARALPDFSWAISKGVSLHQYHGGKTRYYQPKPSTISMERFNEGCAINRAIFDQWDGGYTNPQTWNWGTIGVTEVISNWKD